MTNYTDRSAEALIARRALAEKATPGPWKQPGRCFVVSIVSKKEPIIGDMKTVADATFIAANDPTTILADIDEILRLRADVTQLQKMVEGYKASAVAAWGGEIPSPLYGHKAPTEEDMVAMFEHLNCPWCGGSGHVGDCTEADQAVKGKMERLEKEADWLARAASNNGWHGERVSPEWMRETARKAVDVEEPPCPKD